MAVDVTTMAHDLGDRVAPSHTALLLIDVQNDFCHIDGAFGRLGFDLSTMAQRARRLGTLLAEARNCNLLIIFIRATYDDDVLGGPLSESYSRRDFRLCLENSWGAEWYGGIEPRQAPNESVITKHRFSAFCGTPLDLYLRSNGIRTLVVTGVTTSGCVESTVRDGFFLDYSVVVARDCVAEAFGRRWHEASLGRMAMTYGPMVESEAIISAWRDFADNRRSWLTGTKAASLPAGLAERVAPPQTALVLVDLQNDFCDPLGAIGRTGEDLGPIQATLPIIREILTAAREAGLMVIHVRSEHDSLAASSVSLSATDGRVDQCCVPGTWGAEFVGGLGPHDGEPVVTKHRTSPLPDSRLELLLRAKGMRTVIVAGVTTPHSVDSTVRDIRQKDFYVVVAEDCVAAGGKVRHLHDASLETMERYFAEVVSSAELKGVWRGGHR